VCRRIGSRLTCHMDTSLKPRLFHVTVCAPYHPCRASWALTTLRKQGAGHQRPWWLTAGCRVRQHGVLAFGGLGKKCSNALHRLNPHAATWEQLATSGVRACRSRPSLPHSAWPCAVTYFAETGRLARACLPRGVPADIKPPGTTHLRCALAPATPIARERRTPGTSPATQGRIGYAS